MSHTITTHVSIYEVAHEYDLTEDLLRDIQGNWPIEVHQPLAEGRAWIAASAIVTVREDV